MVLCPPNIEYIIIAYDGVIGQGLAFDPAQAVISKAEGPTVRGCYMIYIAAAVIENRGGPAAHGCTYPSALLVIAVCYLIEARRR